MIFYFSILRLFKHSMRKIRISYALWLPLDAFLFPSGLQNETFNIALYWCRDNTIFPFLPFLKCTVQNLVLFDAIIHKGSICYSLNFCILSWFRHVKPWTELLITLWYGSSYTIRDRFSINLWAHCTFTLRNYNCGFPSTWNYNFFKTLLFWLILWQNRKIRLS